MLQELVPDTKGLVACFGLPVFYEGARLQRGGRGLRRPAAGPRGQAAPGGRRHPLRAALVPPLAGRQSWAAIEIGGNEYPIGDLLFDCGGVRIGFEICRDAWVADRTGARLAQRGADVLLNPSASHFAFAKQQIRERFVLEGSRAFCVSYAYCQFARQRGGPLDLRRRHAHRHAAARCWSAGRGSRSPIGSLTTAVIDVDPHAACQGGEFSRCRSASRDRRRDGCVAVDFRVSATSTNRLGTVTVRTGTCVQRQIRRRRHKCPVIRRGKLVRTRRRKNSRGRCRSRCSTICGRAGRKGFVVSLSGGADSSAVAVLVHLLVQLGEPGIGIRPVGGQAAAHSEDH